MRAAELFGSSIVAVGAFNPAIFSPDWLERNNLLGNQDADFAREHAGLIVSHQFAAVETEWFRLQVLENQFSVTSIGALSPAFRDLANGILTLVPHTPVTAVGLNFMGHFRLDSETEYHRVGDVLAPKDIWRDLYPGKDASAGVDNLTVRIERVARGQVPQSQDAIRITLQPSNRIKFGIFLSYNDHREVRDNESDNLTAAECAAEIVARDWQISWDDAVRAFDGLISKAVAGNPE